MPTKASEIQKSPGRRCDDAIKGYRCKHLIAVIEDPKDIQNIGTAIRNVNALGVERAYVIDPKRSLPDVWQIMRETKSRSRTSGSAIEWSFLKRFGSKDDDLSRSFSRTGMPFGPTER